MARDDLTDPPCPEDCGRARDACPCPHRPTPSPPSHCVTVRVDWGHRTYVESAWLADLSKLPPREIEAIKADLTTRVNAMVERALRGANVFK